MTNNKAIELLDNLIGMVEDNHGSDYDKAIHMAIDAIAADVVEADKAQKEIDYWHDKAQSYEQTILKLSLNKADVVEVVRCKDCKWYSGIGCAIKIVDESDEPTDNDFCSYGEKKDEEDTDESVIAEWICLGHRIGLLKHPYSIDYKCSNCGHEEYTLLSSPPDRCPNCRAHMKGKEDGMQIH